MAEVRTAAQIPQDLAGSGWYEILPPPDGPAVPLRENTAADVVIVGAGFAGLAAAARLLEEDAKLRVTVLEAQRTAFGACGRNSGFMIDLPHELQSEEYVTDTSGSVGEIQENRAAIAYASTLARRFDVQEACDPCGKYHGAADARGETHLNDFARDLERLGEPFVRRSAEDMKMITGTDFYSAGLFTPGCTLIQPAQYIRGIAEGLARRYANFRLYENSPATTLHAGPTVQVDTPDGSVRADRLILTVNGHLQSFGWSPRQLMHVFTYASMTRPLTDHEQVALGGDPAWGLIPAHPMGTTVRRLRDHRIVIRNTFTWNPDMQTTPEQVSKLGERHDESFRARFPMLPAVTMEHRWGGHLCMSRNSVAVFGELERNVFAACCHNGLGTTKGTLGGRLIAEHLLGHRNAMIEQRLAEDPPTRLMPGAIMNPVARTYLKWVHWRAGKDL